MRTHHNHAAGVIPESGAGDPAVVPAPPAVPAMAPNTRVAPARRGGPPGGWDCDVDPEPESDGDATAPDGKDTAARRPGRPRSERAEQAILRATIDAIGERGIDGVHCEDVAARAGVGKATLYRRWPGKEDLLIAAFAAMRRP